MELVSIAHKRSECIGCALCTETAPDYWLLNQRGEAELRHIVRNHLQLDYGEGLPQDLERLHAAEAGCPVNIIRIG